MNHAVAKAAEFFADYEVRLLWYVGEGGAILGSRFDKSVKHTIDRIAANPTIGSVRQFKDVRLRGLRSLVLERPFDKVLIFYRIEEDTVHIWRLMHGARNLSRRLLEPND